MPPFSWPKFLRTLPRARRQPPARRSVLTAEALEDRTVPALVTTTADVLDPSDGLLSLREAIINANDGGDTHISVSAGTYTLTLTGADDDAQAGDLDVTLTSGAVNIFGAGADQTFIDANFIDRVFDVRPGARLFISGVTIRGGSTTTDGGAFRADGQLGIGDSVVEANTAASRGGAVYVGAGVQFATQNVTFGGNFAGPAFQGGTGAGGAVYVDGGTVQVNDTLFVGNRTGTLGMGGAVFVKAGGFAALTSTFDQNVSGMGGAVATATPQALFDPSVAIVESTFTGNRAVYSGASAGPLGGAVFGQSMVSVERSTFTQNEAGAGGRGGALANTTSGIMHVTNTTISGNRAGGTGSGQFGAGAGIYNSGEMVLVNSTVTLNRALGGGFGDGVLHNAPAADFIIQNTIVAQNGLVPGNNGPDTYGNFTSYGGNLIGVQAGSNGWIVNGQPGADQVGTSFVPIDPRLGPLQNNGGPTHTHALRLDSPAIDRGSSAFYLANTGYVDQRTLPRVANGVPDAGAYELQDRTNRAPAGAPDSYDVAEDGLLTVAADTGVLSNDTDDDGDTLDAVLVRTTGSGQLTLNPDGSFTYRPDPDFSGLDSFTYQATDGDLFSTPVTVTIEVTPVNDAPVAADDEYSVDEDGTLTAPVPDVLGSLLANDFDIDGDGLSLELGERPEHGELTLDPDGSFTYTPDPNYNGPDRFTYRVFDGALYSAEAAVSITVRPTNDAPLAFDSLFEMDETQTLDSSIANAAIDPDGDALTFSVVEPPDLGTFSLNADGTFTYTPLRNFVPSVSFTYRVSDGELTSEPATVYIVINNINDPPEAFNVFRGMDEDTSVSDLHFSVRDRDQGQTTLTYTVLPHTNPGVFTYDDRAGTFGYTPPADFNGRVVFEYKVYDGQADSNVATVTFDVRPVNDAPTVAGGPFTLPENSPSGTAVGTVVAADVEGSPLAYSIVGGNTGGAFAIDQSGRITVANPAALDYEMTPTFTLTVEVRDPGGLTGTAAVTVNLKDVAPQLAIDVIPGSTANEINLKNTKEFEVAILSSAEFDARDADPDSIRFGRTGQENSVKRHPKRGVQYRFADVNGDGRLDLVVTIETSKTGLRVGDTSAVLTWRLFAAPDLFTATDRVSVKGPGK